MQTTAKVGQWWACCSLFALGCFAFAPTVQFDFVNWDDPAYVWHNELIRSWSPANLYGVATESVTRNYAPLTILSLLIDHTLWGMEAGGYHATNVILHALNGVLVYLLMRQLTQSGFVAWATAALFLVHPIQIETVAWISSRKGLLSGTLILAALIVRLRPSARAGEDGWYIGFLAAALLSKALAVVVPPIVLLYDIWVRRDRFSDAIVRQVIPGLLSLLLMLHTMGAQNAILGGVRGHMELSLPEIMAVDITILCRYLRMLVYPNDLCVLYDPPTTGILGAVLAGAAAWGIGLTVVWKSRRTHPLWIWGVSSFLLLLFPVLNFFRITTLMNDRYLYLPCIVVFAMIAAGVSRVMQLVGLAVSSFSARILSVPTHSAPTLSKQVPLILSGACCFCALLASLSATNNYLPVWRNSDSLWAHAMQHVPQLSVVRIQLALTLHDSGRTSEAVQVLAKARQECAADTQDQNRMDEAIRKWNQELAQATRRNPDFR
jgi:protein O-mannosyl-transferase